MTTLKEHMVPETTPTFGGATAAVYGVNMYTQGYV